MSTSVMELPGLTPLAPLLAPGARSASVTARRAALRPRHEQLTLS
jgi:hypothetical protein